MLSIDPGLGIERVDAVLALGRVDHDDGHGGVAALVERQHAPLVGSQVGDDALAQLLVVGERRRDGRHRPIVGPPTERATNPGPGPGQTAAVGSVARTVLDRFSTSRTPTSSVG